MLLKKVGDFLIVAGHGLEQGVQFGAFLGLRFLYPVHLLGVYELAKFVSEKAQSA